MAYEGRILARSPFFITATGTTLESATMDLYIWAGDITTDKPASAQYSILKTPLQSGDDDITFEISELIRDYFVKERDAYTTTVTNFADVVWVDVEMTVVDSTGVNSTTSSYAASDAYSYFDQGANAVIEQTDFTTIVLTDEDIRVPVQISIDDNNYIKFYDLDGVLRFDSGTIADGTNSQGKISYITQAQSSWNMSRADIGHTAGSINYTITFVQSEQCMQDATEVKFYDKDGALSILWFQGLTKESLNVNRKEYRSDLGSSNGSAWTYSTEEHQTQTYNVSANETLTLNTGFVPDSMNVLFKQLLLSEYVWVDDKPAVITQSNLEYRTNKVQKLINYQMSFKYSNDVLNNIY